MIPLKYTSRWGNPWKAYMQHQPVIPFTWWQQVNPFNDLFHGKPPLELALIHGIVHEAFHESASLIPYFSFRSSFGENAWSVRDDWLWSVGSWVSSSLVRASLRISCNAWLVRISRHGQVVRFGRPAQDEKTAGDGMSKPAWLNICQCIAMLLCHRKLVVELWMIFKFHCMLTNYSSTLRPICSCIVHWI